MRMSRRLQSYPVNSNLTDERGDGPLLELRGYWIEVDHRTGAAGERRQHDRRQPEDVKQITTADDVGAVVSDLPAGLAQRALIVTQQRCRIRIDRKETGGRELERALVGAISAGPPAVCAEQGVCCVLEGLVHAREGEVGIVYEVGDRGDGRGPVRPAARQLQLLDGHVRTGAHLFEPRVGPRNLSQLTRELECVSIHAASLHQLTQPAGRCPCPTASAWDR